MDKRRFTRVPYRARTRLATEDLTVTGVARDLSISGIFVEATGRIESGSSVEVILLPSESQDEVSIAVTGRVVRSTAGGLAVQFDLDGVDIETLTTLRYIIATEGVEPEVVIREYGDHLDRAAD